MIVTNPDGFPSNFGPQLNNKLYALNKEPFKLPPNSDQDLTEIKNILPGNLHNDPRIMSYTKFLPLKPDHVKCNKDLLLDGFRAEMIRVLPNALPILDEEIKWLMPFSVDDVMWDHEDFDLRTTVNQLVLKANSGPLPQHEQTMLQNLIELNPFVLKGEANPDEDNHPANNPCGSLWLDSIPGIVEHNPKMISNIMVNLTTAYHDIMSVTLKIFIDEVKMTINSLEVIFQVLQTTQLPQEFLDCYIYKWFEYCKTLNEDPKIQRRKLKLISSFLTHLLEKKLFNAATCYDVWMKFCTEFEHFKSVKDLSKLQMENSEGGVQGGPKDDDGEVEECGVKKK